MVKSKVVSCALTEKEYEELSILLAKRIAEKKGYVSMSTYLAEIVRAHLNGKQNVSPPERDTDNEQKDKWHSFDLDDMYEDT